MCSHFIFSKHTRLGRKGKYLFRFHFHFLHPFSPDKRIINEQTNPCCGGQCHLLSSLYLISSSEYAGLFVYQFRSLISFLAQTYNKGKLNWNRFSHLPKMTLKKEMPRFRHAQWRLLTAFMLCPTQTMEWSETERQYWSVVRLKRVNGSSANARASI